MAQERKDRVVILSAVRTAIGTFGGIFKDVPASELGRIVSQEAIARAGIQPDQLNDVLMGNCMSRTDEINIGRVISLKAGIPPQVPACTIQRQCSSAMQAMVFGMQQIQTGESEVILAGGVENMSRIPFALYDMRWGKRMWDGKATDMLTEGLNDPIGHFHMGITAENLAEEFHLTREEQDELALTSQNRAIAAIDEGRFKDEIVPVVKKGRKGEEIALDQDEHPRRGTTMEKLAKLKPAFRKDGTVTAGNASGINDGAAATVLASERFAEKHGLKPLAYIVGHQVAGVEPERMGYGPVPAIRKLLERQKLSISDIELIELNEAFAAQYLACEKSLGLDRSITNVNGSGIALGHPVGATGCRIVVTLLHEMQHRNLHRGIAALCVGGGMGKAMMIERP